MMHTLIRYLIIITTGTLLFVPLLGHAHLFDWDEINFAECAREMILSGDYLRPRIDFQPFWEKPPLFIWMQVLSMKIFGINEFAARFPNALTGVATLCVLYHAGKRVVHEKMATWWVFLYAATWLPHFYFKSGIIDPVFNLFIFLAFYQLHLTRFSGKKMMHALLSGLFLGLAVMTKGPVAILVAVLALGVYILVNRGLWGYRLKHLAGVGGGALIVCLAWFMVVIAAHGWTYFQWFLDEFVTYQIRLFRTEDADHGGPFIYHFIVLLLGCFPASLFLFQYSRRRFADTEPSRDFTRWMWILFWVVLLLFSVVRTKIVHYSSLCYFPLTYLAALQLYRITDGQVRLKPLVRNLLLITGSLLAAAIMLLPVAGLFRQAMIPYIKDQFAVANLQAVVPWSFAECIWGLLYLAGVWASVFLMRRNFRKGMLLLGIVQILIIQVTVVHFTPKIEAYSQRAAIEFFQSFRGKDVYVHVLGYKSYAHLFYTEKNEPENPLYYDHSGRVNEQWLLSGDIDKPAFFACKITAAGNYADMPGLKEIGRKNGFVFFERAGPGSIPPGTEP